MGFIGQNYFFKNEAHFYASYKHDKPESVDIETHFQHVFFYYPSTQALKTNNMSHTTASGSKVLKHLALYTAGPGGIGRVGGILFKTIKIRFRKVDARCLKASSSV